MSHCLISASYLHRPFFCSLKSHFKPKSKYTTTPNLLPIYAIITKDVKVARMHTARASQKLKPLLSMYSLTASIGRVGTTYLRI